MRLTLGSLLKGVTMLPEYITTAIIVFLLLLCITSVFSMEFFGGRSWPVWLAAIVSPLLGALIYKSEDTDYSLRLQQENTILESSHTPTGFSDEDLIWRLRYCARYIKANEYPERICQELIKAYQTRKNPLEIKK